MTYLPDPMASEVAVRFFGHPNIDPGTIITIPLYPVGDWPAASPFVVELYEDASAPPSFDAGSRYLRVPLAKAGRAVVRMSMKLSDTALAMMGVFAWLSAADQAAQQQGARDGQHWMLTPWRELEVVHAVQRPLKTPDIATVTITRGAGETNARRWIVAQCSVASTDRLDLYSCSHEPVDGGAGPGDQQRNDTAFTVKVTDPSTYATVVDGSPGGGRPDYTMAGTDKVAINSSDPNVTVKAHEFHDTRYRRITYWFDATSRFREFLPASLLTPPPDSGPVPIDDNITVTGASPVTWIPSSASPPALRVYLGRPWNVTGYGEMLGVVLPPAGFSDDPETSPEGHPLKNYVTQWAADPVWNTDFVPGATLRFFPGAHSARSTRGMAAAGSAARGSGPAAR